MLSARAYSLVSVSDADDRASTRYQPFPSVSEWTRDFGSTVFTGVDSFAAALEAARAEVTPEALRQAVRVATRYAAVDTGAIEGLYAVDRGFTRTIATEAAAWESVLHAQGDEVVRSIEDQLRAYEMVLDAVTGHTILTEAWVRRLHETICRSQETYTVYTEIGPRRQALPTGQYKSMANSPTNPSTGRIHHYAPVMDTPTEMARLVSELRSEAFQGRHPVVQAAYAHYAFACIHPFSDGNGRVARALASVFLYRAPGVPLVVLADQRDTYLDALEAADGGDALAFVRFIRERTIDAIELVRLHLAQGSGPTVDDTVAGLAGALEAFSTGSGAHDLLSYRLLGLLVEEGRRSARAVELPHGVKTGIHESSMGRGVSPPAGYRERSGAMRVGVLTATLERPIHLHCAVRLATWVRAEEGATTPELAATGHHSAEPLYVNAREISPQVSEVLRLKIEAWAGQQLRLLLGDLKEKFETAAGPGDG